MNSSENPVLERQLLLQFGDRLKRLRKAGGRGTVEMAQQIGISRTTLAAVEAGDPGPSMGTYLRVMSALGVSGELALLAGDMMAPALANTAAARSRRDRPSVQVIVSTDTTRHRAQDLQSLALHEEAVRLLQADPLLRQQAQATLDRWLADGDSRSHSLWTEWQEILRRGTWRKALGRTRRAQELRQASPLPTLLPEPLRQQILAQIGDLKKGVLLGDAKSIEQAVTHEP